MQVTESDSRNSTVQIRAQMLKKLSGIIDHCEDRCTKGRVKDQSLERIRQGWATVTVNGIKAYLSGLKDMELDDIDKRLEALEHAKQSD